MYLRVMQTVIALALCAIVAKLYLPAANDIGVHIGFVTRGDHQRLKGIEGEARVAARKQLFDRTGVFEGSVSVDGTVAVEGTVAIDGPVEIDR